MSLVLDVWSAFASPSPSSMAIRCEPSLVLAPIPVSTLSALLRLEPSLVHSQHILPASAPHTASFPPQSPGGLLLPVVLAPVLFASLFVQPCILHHASNTHIVTNRIRKHVHGHQSQPYINTVPFMNSFIALSFPVLTQICRYGLRYGLHHRVSFFDSVSKGGSP